MTAFIFSSASRSRHSLKLLLLFCLLPAMAVANAPPHPELSAKYTLDVGVFFPSRSIELSAGLDNRDRDEDIDFVRTVGLDKDDDVFALDFGWRFGEKWSLAGQYFQTSGKSERTLEDSLSWNGVEFGA